MIERLDSESERREFISPRSGESRREDRGRGGEEEGRKQRTWGERTERRERYRERERGKVRVIHTNFRPDVAQRKSKSGGH